MRVLLTVKHGFSAPEKWVGRISKKQSFYALHNCDWNALDWSKTPKSQNLSQKIGGPPITVQPVTHSILTADIYIYIYSWNAKRILVSAYPYLYKQAEEPQKIANYEEITKLKLLTTPTKPGVTQQSRRILKQPLLHHTRVHNDISFGDNHGGQGGHLENINRVKEVERGKKTDEDGEELDGKHHSGNTVL